MSGRKIFQNGDVLSAQDVNAIAYPYLDGQDFIGHGDKLPDSDLDDSPDQIKNRFYSFYDRLKVSYSTGLTFSYLGGSILLASGVVASIAPGTIAISNNSSRFIFVNTNGVVASAATLPNECFPMARVTVAGGVIAGSVADLRDKLTDHIRPASIPTLSQFQPGMGMEYWGATLPAGGWLWQDGSFYDPSVYPDLFAVIGYVHGQSGLLFKVPDRRGRVGVGAGTGVGLTARSLGANFGEESVTLNVAQIPSHTHGLNDPSHSHAFVDPGHNHSVNDPGHNHGLPGQTYDTDAGEGSDGDGSAYQPRGNYTLGNSTGIYLSSSSTGCYLNSSATGISINSQGGGGSHNNIQPSISCNFIIKT